MSKIAIVFGATGLIGNHVVENLLNDNRYSRIKIFVRRKTEHKNPKIEEIIFRGEELNNLSGQITGDDLFCCVGTTIKKAGSQAEFRKVDYEIPLKLAEISKKNGISSFLVVSSIGANAKSGTFYLRVKGEMEEALKGISLKRLIIARPSLLFGKRQESRIGESISKLIMAGTGFMLFGKLKKYRGIHGNTVALALIQLANSENTKETYESDELESLGKFTV